MIRFEAESAAPETTPEDGQVGVVNAEVELELELLFAQLTSKLAKIKKPTIFMFDEKLP